MYDLDRCRISGGNGFYLHLLPGGATPVSYLAHRPVTCSPHFWVLSVESPSIKTLPSIGFAVRLWNDIVL